MKIILPYSDERRQRWALLRRHQLPVASVLLAILIGYLVLPHVVDRMQVLRAQKLIIRGDVAVVEDADPSWLIKHSSRDTIPVASFPSSVVTDVANAAGLGRSGFMFGNLYAGSVSAPGEASRLVLLSANHIVPGVATTRIRWDTIALARLSSNAKKVRGGTADIGRFPGCSRCAFASSRSTDSVCEDSASFEIITFDRVRDNAASSAFDKSMSSEICCKQTYVVHLRHDDRVVIEPRPPESGTP